MKNKKLAYYQGGGGVNEPTPGKKKYKSDPAILVQPRFKEPFYRNYDLYDTEGVDGPAVHGPGSGWHHMNEFNSIKEFLDYRRQRLKGKYVADDFWIEDTEANRKQRADKMKVRANLFNRIIKRASQDENDGANYDYGDGAYTAMSEGKKMDNITDAPHKSPGAFFADDNEIDFEIDSMIGSEPIRGTSDEYEKPDKIGPAGGDDFTFPTTEGLGDEESYPYSAQIGGLLDKYLPLNDFEGKPDSDLDIGRDYTEDAEPSSTLSTEDLEHLSNKYLSPKENSLYGLPDGISPPDDLDPSATINQPNPELGETESGNTMYEDKWNI